MLLVVCPNLAIDRILVVDNFQAQEVHRSRAVAVQPGGKGSNVARVFRQLGGEVVLAGFVGRSNGKSISAPLRAKGIQLDAVEAYDGDSRTCTIICDPAGGAHPTVVNEESPEIEPGSANRLLDAVDRWLPLADAVLTTGSLARGLPDDFYAEVLSRARGKFTAVDAAGTVLLKGLSARPMFMKPNVHEFGGLFSGSKLVVLPEHTAITNGEHGATLIHQGRCYHAAPPRVYHVNPIGSGDAFVAGYLHAQIGKRSVRDSLCLAIAAAASDAGTLLPGVINPRQVQSFLPEVACRFT